MVDLLGRTPVVGDLYLLAGIVRAIESGTLVVVPGPGYVAVRVAEGQVVRLQDLAAVAYVDSSVATAVALAAATFQPKDTVLDILSSFDVIADTMPYFTGASTGARTAFTALARSLIAEATARGAAGVLKVPCVVGSESGDPVRTVGNNSTAEVDLFSGTITANTMGTNGRYDLNLEGDVLNSSGATNNLTIRVKYGATTFWGDIGGVTNSTTRRSLRVRLAVSSRGSGKQRVTGEVALGDGNPGTIGGSGNLFSAGPHTTFHGDATEDTTSDKTLKVTAQWGTASASSELRLYDARLVFVPAA